MSTTAMLKLGPVAVDPPLFLAPMAGVTDRDFRLIVRRIGGVGVVAMEFVPAKGLAAGERYARKLMHFSPEERPLAIQIYGSEARSMAEAARIVEAHGADLCDINMGCPANKVLAGCAGAALMGDLGKARAIIEAVAAAISIPLTVKFRLGLDERRQNYLELGRICEAVGVAAVTMHGRTARQGFSGEALWEPIRRLKEALSIPVIGNGDVATAAAALRLFSATGCDAVMIGRAATRDPWIFRQVAARMGYADFREPSLEDRCALILNHFRAVAERESERDALHKLRLFTRWYSQGLPGGHGLRRQIQAFPDVRSFLAGVEEFFAGLTLRVAA